MLVITGTIRLGSVAELERVRGALVARAERSRSDAGCLDYQFAQSLDDPTELRLIEKWASQADLDAHLAVPDPAFSELLATADLAAATVLVCEAGEERVMLQR
jgi:quinol monooxygenase YgiN